MYVEVPAPDLERRHEYNSNHYSVLGVKQWDALLTRAGFTVDTCNTIDFDIEMPKDLTKTGPDDERITMKEKFFVMLTTKQCPLDIK